MENIIIQDEIEKHDVQRYRFKVLGSMPHHEEQNSEPQDVTPAPDNTTSTAPKTAENVEGGFVEELLKRSDELSSNIIKFQMQIEKQEADFEQRLKEEVTREKALSFQEGYDKAKADLESSYQTIVETFEHSNQKLNDKLNELEKGYKKTEKELANSAIEIAEEIIKKELTQASSEIAVSLAKNLMSEVQKANHVTLKVNPDNFQALEAIYKENEKITVETDDAISKGGVILLSESGNLDGTISERLAKVKHLLKDS
ncbi:flagellar assembly protein FliH [Sulfurospirillum sp. 1612]|uniref:flagellar assembly protein FliH n=1 Tax=Sulfurospirillum sp. 1612 TaxID=3094835 RepID=UPI002F9327DC